MVTREQILEKVACLEVQAHDAIVNTVSQFLESGVINLDHFENTYALPKIVYAEALRRLADAYMPLSRDYREVARQLKNF